jgi:hypothetical protein
MTTNPHIEPAKSLPAKSLLAGVRELRRLGCGDWQELVVMLLQAQTEAQLAIAIELAALRNLKEPG